MERLCGFPKRIPLIFWACPRTQTLLYSARTVWWKRGSSRYAIRSCLSAWHQEYPDPQEIPFKHSPPTPQRTAKARGQVWSQWDQHEPDRCTKPTKNNKHLQSRSASSQGFGLEAIRDGAVCHLAHLGKRLPNSVAVPQPAIVCLDSRSCTTYRNAVVVPPLLSNLSVCPTRLVSRSNGTGLAETASVAEVIPPLLQHLSKYTVTVDSSDLLVMARAGSTSSQSLVRMITGTMNFDSLPSQS